MRILYLDCFSGISGDMTVAALVDAGADKSYIEEELGRIRLEPYSLEWKRVVKRGISAQKFDVNLDPQHPPKHQRHYSEIVKVIQAAGFNPRVTALSLAIFEKIGFAEAKIHDIPVEKVHFHEVGAIDSIVDIVAAALAIDSLQIDKIYASPVPLGSGTIHIDHGIYPVPAPATLEMMRGIPIASTNYSLELTTPTGAGIISGIVDEFSKSIPLMILETIGYGAGTRDLPNQPNVLRVVIGKTDPLIGKWQVTHEHLPGEHHHHHHHEDHHHRAADSVPHEHGEPHAHEHDHTRVDHGHALSHDHHKHDHTDEGSSHDHSHSHREHDNKINPGQAGRHSH